MQDRKQIPGKFVWYEVIAKNTEPVRAFYREVLGWRVEPFSMNGTNYTMIYAGATPDSMIGGFKQPRTDRESSRWISYVSVVDVDSAARIAAASGGKVVEPPTDVQDIGRMAGITDPQGAEMYLYKGDKGDPPDPPDGRTPTGRFFWNELHTREPEKALAFYEKVVGFTHRSMDMGPGGTYHILSKGGVDRGGVTSHLPAGVPPHWLPYVHVDDVDDVITRARKLGAKIPMAPEDIPGVGRFSILADPSGAALAIMKPSPMEQQQQQQQSKEHAGTRR